MCLMQLMLEDHAIIYNLQPENRYEVLLIHEIENFDDPIKFGITGFNFVTLKKSLLVNKSLSFGI